MNKYLIAYKEIEKSIKKDKNNLKHIEAIALTGSVSQNEQSERWSDLDILLILKSDRVGNVSMIVLNKIKKIVNKISQKYSFPISILAHTLNDLSNYVSFEYLIHYSSAVCTYPEKDFIYKKIFKIIEQRQINLTTKRRYCVYSLRHIRFNLLRKYISLNQNNPINLHEFGKLLIDEIIKTGDVCLNYYDIWPKKKEEILMALYKKIPLDHSPFEKALKMRKEWKSNNDKEILSYIPSGLNYMISLMAFVLKNNKEATPEEKITL